MSVFLAAVLSVIGVGVMLIALPVYETCEPPQRVMTSRPVTRTAQARVQRLAERDWTKTSMVIGGTTAAGAGVGAMIGGKTGALIGAAFGGGWGTLFETRQR
jgi:uncharacterized protein YcfJ